MQRLRVRLNGVYNRDKAIVRFYQRLTTIFHSFPQKSNRPVLGGRGGQRGRLAGSIPEDKSQPTPNRQGGASSFICVFVCFVCFTGLFVCFSLCFSVCFLVVGLCFFPPDGLGGPPCEPAGTSFWTVRIGSGISVVIFRC